MRSSHSIFLAQTAVTCCVLRGEKLAVISSYSKSCKECKSYEYNDTYQNSTPKIYKQVCKPKIYSQLINLINATTYLSKINTQQKYASKSVPPKDLINLTNLSLPD